jgi:hypothetical protein
LKEFVQEKEQLGKKILKMIHLTPLKIKINQHQITSIFRLQSILNSHFQFIFLIQIRSQATTVIAVPPKKKIDLISTRNGNIQRTIENKIEFKYGNYKSGNQSKNSNLEIKVKIQI